MGGYGSGDRTPRAVFGLVERAAFFVDVRQLARHGLFRDGAREATASRKMRDGTTWSVGVFPHGDGSVSFRWSVSPAGRPDERRDVEQAVALAWTPCHIGGRRPWFECAGCGGRCALLYMDASGGRLACRSCQRLRHMSTRQTDLDRTMGQVVRLLRNVFGLPADHGAVRDPLGWGRFYQPPRPPGMMRATYRRQLAQLDLAQARMMDAWLAELRAVVGRFR